VQRSLALASHGGMQRPEYAHDTFRHHFDSCAFHRKQGGFTLLEMGPGDSLFTALIARAYGASASWLVDIAPFASSDVSIYRTMADFLKTRDLSVPDTVTADSIDNVLASCRAAYMTEGLKSLRELPSGSIDFIFSNSVLQAVRRDEFVDTLGELRRLIHPEGCSVHSIDLRDMMSLSLHHLRFSDRVWESEWIRNSGFYTNRLRLAEIVALAQKVGLDAEASEVNRWAALPVDRKKLARPYRNMSDEELLPATIRLILRPMRPGPARQTTGGATL
jgi:hypothetical protein